ncbi:hypothetical protein ACFLZV_06885 [Candidatus Margulisiibacteriota bacterium]
MQERLDNFITKLAIKNFSITVIWIKTLLVLLLAFFIGLTVFFSLMPIDISIPVSSPEQNTIIISKAYFADYPSTDTIIIKQQNKCFSLTISRKVLDNNSGLKIITKEALPESTKNDRRLRLITGRKNIWEMLLKTKKLD